MFSWIVERSLRNRAIVLAAAALLALYGAFSLRGIPVDVFPDLNRPTVSLMTEAEGLAPEEVEQLVSFPIETAMNGMPGVLRVRSVSGVGLSIVFVEFDWGTDLFLNRQQVAERLALVRGQLPPGTQPQMGPISSIMGEILLIAVQGKGVAPMALRELADWTLRPRLLTVPGVAQVIPIGGEVRQYRVAPDPVALERLDVPLEAVERALKGFGANSAGGFVDQSAREYLIRNIGRTARLDDLRSLVVAYRGDRPVLLGQVAAVDYAPRVKRGDAGYMGEPAVIVSVQKQPAADTVRLTREIEASLRELQATLPPGITLDRVLFRQADFIERAVGNVERVLVEASAVVAVVLFLFLLNVRTTAISLAAIPISVLVTVLVLDQMGLSINTMTLGGLAIAIGELVDDAVVDVENIFRRLRQNAALPQPKPAIAVVAEASVEVRSGILYATLVVVLAFAPLFALSGIEGRLFASLGIAYVVSILASLLTAVTVTPVLGHLLLPGLRRMHGGEGALVRFLKRLNERAVRWALARPAAVVAGAVACVGVAAVAVPGLPRAFLPPFNEGTLTVNLLFQPGISLGESARLAAVAERLALQVPEVRSVGRRTGRAELDEHAEGVHSSELEIDLDPSGRPRPAVMQDLRSRLQMLPAAVNIGQPISHRLDHMLSGVRAEVVLKLFGDDLDTLRTLAGELEARLSGIPGIVDLQVERQVRIPQLRAVVDYGRALLHGVTPAAVTEALEGLANGRAVAEVIDGSRRFQVVIRLGDADRTAEGLQVVLVETPGGRVPLAAVARIGETDGPNQILREGAQRRIAVLANTDGRDMAEVVAAVRAAVAAQPLPLGYYTRLEGTFQAQEQAQQLIALLALVSLALIFLVLHGRYRSTALTLVVMANVPLAMVGGVAGLWIAGQPLSVASMVGFVTLAGIAARNGILKVSHYINLALSEGERFGPALILRGTQERLTPVLMTALSAGLALVPLLLGAGEPGTEILHPVAVVIFGGLISATALDAVLTPVLFHRFGKQAIERLAAGSTGTLAEAY